MISTLLISLLLLGTDWQIYIEQYNHLLQEKELPPVEIVWAIGALYYSSPVDIQEAIIDEIQHSYIREQLKESSDQNSFILNINNHLKSETFLLLALLQENNPEIRRDLFKKFYSENTDTDLKKINEYAVSGDQLEPEDLQIEKFRFHHFLITYYLHTNKIISDRVFSFFSEYWLNRHEEINIPDYQKEFLYLTLIKTSYESDNYEFIGILYNDVQNLKYIPPSTPKRNIFWSLDFAMYRLGNIDKSLEIQRNYTIPISEYLGDQSTVTSIYTSMGGYLYMLGKYQDAREVFLSALENSDQHSEAVLTRLYNNLSLVYFKTGESDKYIEMQLKALEHANKQQNYSHQIQIYRNLHIFYRKNRNWDLSEDYIEQASKLAIEKNHQSDLVSIYISQAVFEDRYLGNSEAAHEKLHSAKSFYNEDVDPRYLIRILVEQADLLINDQKWSESKNLLDEAKNIAVEYSNSTAFLEILVKLAFVEYNGNQILESEQLLKEFRAHDVTVVDFPILVLAQTLQAQLLENKGDLAEAETLLASASELVLERARNTSELETGYWSVEPEYLHLFDSYANFLISRNRPEEALTLLDRVKTINDASLVQNPLVKSSVLSEEELSEERQLTEQMDQIRKRIFNATADEKLSLQNELESLSARKRELNRNLNETHDQELPKIWNIQRSLNPGQQILHVTELEQKYYLSHISKNSVTVKKLDLTDENISLFENAVASVINGHTNLEDLYQAGRFIGLQNLSLNTRSIIMIPDGYFHQIPLDIIPLNQPESPFSYGSATYTIEQMDVRYLNSLSDLIQKKRNSTASYAYDYTGFGISDFRNENRTRELVPLPKAPQEVQNISSNLDRMNSKNTFLNEIATPQQFRNAAGKSRILHMATHSEVSDSDPLFSRLHLSAEPGTEPDDDVADHLFAYELFDLNLQNQLVMLNSCESGGDRFLQGSGIMGISRALRYAGAHSLVLNAWSVNDQFAADFAEKFYSYLNEGESKSRALQLTKIHFIKEKNANPHYWGPYMLNGDNRPLLSKKEDDVGVYILAGLFFTGFIVLRRDITKHKRKKAA